MTKRITVSLTEDQQSFLADLVGREMEIIKKAYKPEYVKEESAFAGRILTKLLKARS